MAVTLHPAIQRQLVGGKDLLADIERVSAYLAELMREVHGDSWSVSVNHDGCFVMIARDFLPARPVDKSNNGGN
ncbi:hypothetical protein RMR10_012085 [Agrobacterium rosae]|uniref:hypothetical protein n=1 Tax=Agrobacterium rosae TaxID=1972867 RepID=UPI002A10E6D3|nr:hypothetical protein [Agrobacterium rosae]MDX8313368.1 hypothetical protein [Agrobacterium rosae]